MTTNPKTAVRAERERAGLTRADFATEIGQSVSFIARLEAGKPVALTPKVALRICRTLNLPAKKLFKEFGE